MKEKETKELKKAKTEERAARKTAGKEAAKAEKKSAKATVKPVKISLKKEAQQFFAQYGEALLSRDAARIAGHYASPCFIVAPGHLQAVTDPAETEAFFAQSLSQYDGVETAEPEVELLKTEVEYTLWAVVTWSYAKAGEKKAKPQEKMCYQLAQQNGQWKIACLSMLEL